MQESPDKNPLEDPLIAQRVEAKLQGKHSGSSSLVLFGMAFLFGVLGTVCGMLSERQPQQSLMVLTIVSGIAALAFLIFAVYERIGE